MRKLVLIAAAFAMVGCVETEELERPEKRIVQPAEESYFPEGRKLWTVNFDRHQWVVLLSSRGDQFLHHPGCRCLK